MMKTSSFALVIVALLSHSTVASIQLLVPQADANSQNGAIRQYDGTTGASLGVLVAPSVELNMPNGTAIGADGQLYVSSHGGGVLKYDLATGQFLQTFVAAGSGGLGSPSEIAFGPDGNLYVPSNNGSVLRFNGSTGAFIDVFATGLSLPQDLVFGPNGDLYVSSAFNDRINRYDSTGMLLQSFGAPALDGPLGLAIRNDQPFLYVASAFTDSILRFDLVGNFVDEFIASGTGGLRTPIDLAFRSDGELFVNSRIEGSFPTRGAVLHYDGDSGAFVGSFTTDGEVDVPRGGMMFLQNAVPEMPSIVIWSFLVLVSVCIGPAGLWDSPRQIAP